MHPVTIRRYRETDLEVVVKIWLESWKSTGVEHGGSITIADLRERLPREIAGGWQVHVTTSGVDIIGFIAFHTDYLAQLFIAPGMQSQGIGKSLLDFAKIEMPNGFWLTTAADSLRACRFYEREGFARGDVSLHTLGHPIVRYDWVPNP